MREPVPYRRRDRKQPLFVSLHRNDSAYHTLMLGLRDSLRDSLCYSLRDFIASGYTQLAVPIFLSALTQIFSPQSMTHGVIWKEWIISAFLFKWICREFCNERKEHYGISLEFMLLRHGAFIMNATMRPPKSTGNYFSSSNGARCDHMEPLVFYDFSRVHKYGGNKSSGSYLARI